MSSGEVQHCSEIVDHGYGIYTVQYRWRDAAEALCEFCKQFPNRQITAMMEERKDKGGKITLATEYKETYHSNSHRGPG